jgi:heterotetrameric sarcosine oxidase delta subunit
MLQINCPWCGIRDQEEFTFGGQAHRQRPSKPAQTTDAEWSAYLFNRTNPKGVHREKWRHTFGCRQWFNVARHTVTHEVFAIYPMTDVPMAELDKDLFEGRHAQPVEQLMGVAGE